jgi:glycosyltransferase involved in cell wall biosynthesis
MADSVPEVGIVVIGRNERTHLAECISALKGYHERLVYADSASTDGSAELAAELGAVIIRLSEDQPLTPARGRNAGFVEVRERWPSCQFVQFIDGDSVVEPGWIAAGAAFLRANDRAAVVAGHCIEAFPEDSVYNWMCGEEWATSLGLNVPYGGNAMMRAVALGEAGLFRTDMRAGEEAELAGRLRSLGWETWRIDEPMVRHDAAISNYIQWRRRAPRGGFGYASAWTATRHQLRPLYAAQLRSAILWVIGVPLIVGLMSWMIGGPWLLLAIPIVYAAQVARIASRRGLGNVSSWRYATLLTIAKFAEMVGIIEFVFSGRRLSVALDHSVEPPVGER